MARRNSAQGKIIGAVIVIVIVGLAAWWYFTRMPGVDFSRQGPAPSGPAKASTAPAPIEHPISQAQTGPAPATTSPLPSLDNSDSAVASALAAIPGADGLTGLLLARGLIPHIVATVDALPRRSIGVSILPLRTPKGTFAVDTSSGKPMLDSKDFARYDPYMKIAEAVDSRTLVTWYVHWYPLFQQAYRELGYPQGYFNDRLIAAIDDMLAAPNAQPPVALAATADGHYVFADPTWESLSVGQKLMIRIGPEHERALKTKLRSIRALLLGKAPEFHTGAPESAPSSAAPQSATSTQ
ncbi:MAG TPA: DUF3014 domain-containing protein [Rhodanobacteraceae bacterium]|nr:DUF3014 domain-containing protein [Rhodanobacteraceae bacterium]